LSGDTNEERKKERKRGGTKEQGKKVLRCAGKGNIATSKLKKKTKMKERRQR
jgi:hypothetical protein